MDKNILPTPEQLRQRLKYDPDTGKLFWKNNGKEAFTYTSKRGYKVSTFRQDDFCKTLSAHRVVWAIYYDKWPTDQIDHINRDKTDNRIVNLRDVDNATNTNNHPIRKTNKSGVVGVYKHSQTGKWVAQITKNYKCYHLGCFDTVQEAKQARGLWDSSKLAIHKSPLEWRDKYGPDWSYSEVQDE